MKWYFILKPSWFFEGLKVEEEIVVVVILLTNWPIQFSLQAFFQTSRGFFLRLMAFSSGRRLSWFVVELSERSGFVTSSSTAAHCVTTVIVIKRKLILRTRLLPFSDAIIW